MANSGGSYVVVDGVRKKVTGTEHHPDGDRPRDSNGKPLGKKAENRGLNASDVKGFVDVFLDNPEEKPAARKGKQK